MTEDVTAQPAELRLHRLGGFRARIDAVLDGRVLVTPLAPLPVERDRVLGLAAEITVPTSRGMWVAEGSVTSTADDGTVEVRLARQAQVAQRREHVRLPTYLPAVVVPRDAAHPPLHTYTLDISGGGIQLAGAGPHEPGTAVTVTVKLTDDEPLTVDGRIARRTARGSVGIAFEDIAEDERERIVRWIFERQRLQRAAERGRR
jgi:hypothetical protein